MFSIKIDLHVHTNRSDGTVSPDIMANRAKKLGLDGIAITDHDVAITEDEVFYLADKHNLIIIPGVEITTKQGHILGLGIFETPEKNLDLRYVINFIRHLGGIVIIPHPFDFLRNGIGKYIKEIKADAIEVINGGVLLDRFNKKAFQFAKENNITMVAGSDAHDPDQLGYAYTIINSEEKDYEEVLKSIILGHTQPVGKKYGILSKIKVHLKKIKMKF